MTAKPKKKIFPHIINIVTVAIVIEAFLCAMMIVRVFARENCFEIIEETAGQAAEVFTQSMKRNREQLKLFADILATNSSNPDETLQKYMMHFCETQSFSAVCVHRADGTTVSYGDHPHDQFGDLDYNIELAKLPYTSDVISIGDYQTEKYIYRAIPVVRNGETVGILYGYICLDSFKTFVSSTAFDGSAKFCIVDGDTGEFLLDEYHRYDENGNELPLDNFYDVIMNECEVKSGYSLEEMIHKVKVGESGMVVYNSQSTGNWYYTYYTPMEPNNWSMQITIDEDTAFRSFQNVNVTVIHLMVIVVVMMFMHLTVLMLQNNQVRKKDKHNLRKSEYINKVQGALINANTNPDFIDQALKVVADEMQAETVLLLAFQGKIISDAQYWPSKDKAQAHALLGINIREVFPSLFDRLASNSSAVFGQDSDIELSEASMELFNNLDVRNCMLVPIMDNAGKLKGSLAAVNVADVTRSTEMLECVTYDFFMSITNIENLNIIKSMGSVDYLTGVKNRNCFESELEDYANIKAESLWCVFIDVNGLHEVNNKEGHKAGDVMLRAVANAIKHVFGEKRTYRLGGDEFVAFMTDSSHEEFMGRKYKITEELAERGYYVSVGFEGIERGKNGKFNVESVVSKAEAIMYKDKWEYYQKNDIPTDRGHFPTFNKKED